MFRFRVSWVKLNNLICIPGNNPGLGARKKKFGQKERRRGKETREGQKEKVKEQYKKKEQFFGTEDVDCFLRGWIHVDNY